MDWKIFLQSKNLDNLSFFDPITEQELLVHWQNIYMKKEV